MQEVTEIRKNWINTILKWKLNPDQPATDTIWSPELEASSRDRLREIQSEKLVHAVRYMYEFSSFYRKKLDEEGIKPEDIKSIDDLPKLPIIFKDEMSADIKANPPFGTYTAVDDQMWKETGWQLFNTSGTTAEPRAFRYTQFDREMWSWTDARALYSMGIRSGKDVAMLMFGYGPHVAMWGMHYALNKMNVPIIPAGGMDTRTRAYAISRFHPTVIAATPSYALYLGNTLQEMGMDPAYSSVRIIICLGEPIPPATAKRIQDMWHAEIHQFYGCTEAAPSCGGYTCPYGVHFMEDTHIIETVDPDTLKPVPEGKPGVSVVTNLCSEGSPQIRFMVGDFTTLSYEPCQCGRTHVRAVGGFSGRADDMLNIRGVTLFPSAIEEVVRGFDELGDEFQIVLSRDERGLDEFTVIVEVKNNVNISEEELNHKLESAIRARCELRPKIQIESYGTLPKTEFKAKRVKDLR
jgi:phenylacetate-CoA ligase